MSDQLTVYLVDDDQAVLDSLTGLLAAAHHPTRRFLSAEEFLLALNEQAAGCIVTDLKMTGMSGSELQQELKDADCLLPIIVVTGHATVPVTVDVMENGAVTLLQKPYKPSELLSAVGRALTQYSKLRAQRDETDSIQARVDTLTADEYRAMDLIARGASNREISEDLEVAMRTVDRRRRAVLEKMHAESAADLTRMLTLLRERTQD